MADRPEIPDSQWRTAGDRIQTLLDSCAASGAAAHERAQLLVREVVGLYGAGLERIVTLLGDPRLAEQLATDDLVASLLLVHGLHPHDLRRRVSDALDRVRPYLGSHGGDVDLLEVTDEPEGATVRLQFAGSCKSCPSSAVTLEFAVEDAIRAAAPEVLSIEVVAAETTSTPAVIPAESLLARIKSDAQHGAAWHQVPDLGELSAGEVGGFAIDEAGGFTVLACRVGDQLYAYRDHCPACERSLTGAALHRVLGNTDAVLRCPQCHAHFDVVHAGACVDRDADCHLEPIPLLIRDGALSIAVPAEALGACT
ncbi:NifU family protein [Mycobacterium sp.]|uniref:NifU family protein n=1 Tax=Mycobacterium sp. TaxID=1785 RepID=UPI003C75EAA4